MSEGPGGTTRPILTDRRFLGWVLLVGLILRVLVWGLKGGIHYPDEIFQYLEPGNQRLTGLGWLPWEYERGARSWILPAFYGGLIWWGRLLGLDGFAIHRLLNLHSTLWSLLLIPATYRLACAYGGQSAGRMGAVLSAVYVPVLFYMPHTLNEVPGVLLTTWGLAYYAESRQQDRFFGGPLKAGLVLGLATVLRPTLFVWTVLPIVGWLGRRRWRSLAGLALGGVSLALVSGLVDLLTWGNWFHSTLEYLRYNLIEGKAAEHGTSPWHFYLRTWLWERMGTGAGVVLVAVLLNLRRAGPVFLAAVFPVLVLSIEPHKEERFLLSSYPLLLAAASIGLARWLPWGSGRPVTGGRERAAGWRAMAVGAAVAVILSTGEVGMRSADWRWRADVFAAQDVVSERSDATGVLLEGRIHLNGGYLVLGRHVPQVPFSRPLAAHALFNYVVLEDGTYDAEWAEALGFEPIETCGDMVVLHRTERP